jgi:hypothetical protein
VLVADGGLRSDGTSVSPRRSHFLPARVLMLVFRGKLLDRLGRELARGTLRLPPDWRVSRMRLTLSQVVAITWNVHIRAC